MITPEKILALLHDMLKLDPVVVAGLVEFRVFTDNPEGFESHPTLIPYSDGGSWLSVGLLGVLNGIVGMAGKRLVATFGDDNTIKYFSLKDVPDGEALLKSVDGPDVREAGPQAEDGRQG